MHLKWRRLECESSAEAVTRVLQVRAGMAWELHQQAKHCDESSTAKHLPPLRKSEQVPTNTSLQGVHMVLVHTEPREKIQIWPLN